MTYNCHRPFLVALGWDVFSGLVGVAAPAGPPPLGRHPAVALGEVPPPLLHPVVRPHDLRYHLLVAPLELLPELRILHLIYDGCVIRLVHLEYIPAFGTLQFFHNVYLFNRFFFSIPRHRDAKLHTVFGNSPAGYDIAHICQYIDHTVIRKRIAFILVRYDAPDIFLQHA